MKKVLFAVAAVVSMSFPTIARADVIRPNDAASGRPMAVESNTGSQQAMDSRSTTGDTNKFTHDGYREIWDI